MPIEELKEPIWEKQKGETPNQYCYFLEFLKFPTNNLKAFHDHLCEKGNVGQKGTKVPAYKTLRNWSRESCNNWVFRKAAKRKAEDDDIQDTLHELDKEDAIQEFLLKKLINKKILERINREIDEQPLSQLNQGIQGYKTLKDDNRVDKGEATEYTNTKIDADIDAKTETQIAIDFQEAYNELINDTRKDSLHLKDSE